jgi:hypothetical protein
MQSESGTDDESTSEAEAAEATGGRTEESTAESADSCRADKQPHAERGSPQTDERASLLPEDQSERFTTRWQEIQTSFVDKPRDAVAQADALVADLMQRLAAGFSNERERLESQWKGGDDVSTEELRVALTRYRSFFDRLLSA